MRLSCPNCDAIYELSEDRLTPGGGHVQCGECHTRWFARPPAPASPAPAAERPSEDEIIARLETRAAARGPATPAPRGPFSEPIAFPGAPRPQPAPSGAPTGPAPAPPTPLRPRGDRPAPAAAPPALPPRSGRRGGRLGFALALGLVAIGLGLYLGSGVLAARAPSAAPTLHAYAAGIDAARDWVEAALGPLREGAPPDA